MGYDDVETAPLVPSVRLYNWLGQNSKIIIIGLLIGVVGTVLFLQLEGSNHMSPVARNNIHKLHKLHFARLQEGECQRINTDCDNDSECCSGRCSDDFECGCSKTHAACISDGDCCRADDLCTDGKCK